jgi:hypothetical protein
VAWPLVTWFLDVPARLVVAPTGWLDRLVALGFAGWAIWVTT